MKCPYCNEQVTKVLTERREECSSLRDNSAPRFQDYHQGGIDVCDKIYQDIFDKTINKEESE